MPPSRPVLGAGPRAVSVRRASAGAGVPGPGAVRRTGPLAAVAVAVPVFNAAIAVTVTFFFVSSPILFSDFSVSFTVTVTASVSVGHGTLARVSLSLGGRDKRIIFYCKLALSNI